MWKEKALPTATVTTKGQITIPKEIREHLQIQAGDHVDFIVLEDGRVVLKQATLDIESLEGLLYRSGTKRVSIEEMRRVIRRRGGAGT